jgi:hypothetical protein
MPSLDLQTFLEDDQLVLQGVCSDKHPNGKAYTIASPSAKTVLHLKRVMQLWRERAEAEAANEAVTQAAQEDPDAQVELVEVPEFGEDDVEALTALTTDENGQPVDIVQRIMGPTYQQMIDDGVSGDRMTKISNVVMTYYGRNSQLARKLVEAAGESAARPNRTTRRAAGQRAGSKSSRASGATKARTRSQGSTSASTTPEAEPQNKAG